MRVFERNLKIPGSFEHPPGSPVGFVTRGGLLLPPHGRGSRKAGRPYRRRVFQGAPQAQKRRPFPGHPSARAGHAQRRFPQWRRREAVKSLLLRTTRARRSIVSRGARDQVNRLGGPDGPDRPALRPARYRETRSARPPASPPHAERHTGWPPSWPERPATGALPQLGLVAIATEDRPGRSPSPHQAELARGMDNPSARRRVLQCALFCFPASPSRGFRVP